MNIARSVGTRTSPCYRYFCHQYRPKLAIFFGTHSEQIFPTQFENCKERSLPDRYWNVVISLDLPLDLDRLTSHGLSAEVSKSRFLLDEEQERLCEGQSDDARDKESEDDHAGPLCIEASKVRRAGRERGVAESIEGTGRADDEGSIDNRVLDQLL